MTFLSDLWKKFNAPVSADSDVVCPNCHANNLKRLAQLPSESPHNHRYRCLECLLEFSDDSGTPLEGGQPPINIWIQCWYLMGCTDSLTYIAAKLNLDLTTVERMAQQLKRIFSVQKPITRSLDFDSWRKESEGQVKQLKDDLVKQYELLDANVAVTPKDSAEFRRQQNLRRTLEPTLDPTAAVRGPGKKRT